MSDTLFDIARQQIIEQVEASGQGEQEKTRAGQRGGEVHFHIGNKIGL